MAESKIMLGWRDKPEIGAALDKVAQDLGVQRSDIIRIFVRTQLKAAADSRGE